MFLRVDILYIVQQVFLDLGAGKGIYFLLTESQDLKIPQILRISPQGVPA